MKVGDLVTMSNYCAGLPGEVRCESALLLDIQLSHTESYQSDSQAYMERDVYECSLMCRCGTFEEYADNLGMIK